MESYLYLSPECTTVAAGNYDACAVPVPQRSVITVQVTAAREPGAAAGPGH